jgi:single-stranded DNA-binding protein
MANEPQIEFKGKAFEVKTFDNGGSVVKVVTTPSYQDKSTQQWVELEPLYFDVHPYGKEAETQARNIAELVGQNMSVRVLVNGALTEKKGKQGGAFKHVNARTLVVISSRPKQGQQQPSYQSPKASPRTAQQSDSWGGESDGEPEF